MRGRYQDLYNPAFAGICRGDARGIYTQRVEQSYQDEGERAVIGTKAKSGCLCQESAVVASEDLLMIGLV